MAKRSASAAFQKQESAVMHSLGVFLIIYTLVGVDIRSRGSAEEERKATAMWLAWGIPFLLLAFFIITPEQEAIERAMEERST